MKTALALILPVVAILIATGVVITAQACGPLFSTPEPSWPVVIENRAYDVLLDNAGEPYLELVETASPVVFYHGRSLDGCFLAYGPLVDIRSPYEPLTMAQFLHDPEVRPVPNGTLVVEHVETGAVRVVTGGFADAARWSRTDRATIAFTTRGDAFSSGLGVADARTGEAVTLKAEDVYASYIGWHPYRREVQFYQYGNETALALDVWGDPREHRLLEPASFSLEENAPAPLGLPPYGESWDQNLPVLLPFNPEGLAEPLESAEQAWEIRLASGGAIRSNALSLGRWIEFVDENGMVTATTPHGVRLIAVLYDSIVYKHYGGLENTVHHLRSDGHDTLFAASASANFKFPFAASGANPDLTVTQSGAGYTPNCNVWTHIGKFEFAYDIVGGSHNKEVTAASDSFLYYHVEDVWCNSWDNGPRMRYGDDSTYCDDFAVPCPDNGGFGNYVVLANTDGTYTLYAHLAQNSVALPPISGPFLKQGCHIATEGHTGKTLGDFPNGCGDHLHIQKQVTGDFTSDSLELIFSDLAATHPLSCKGYESSTIGMSCIL